MPTIRAIVQNSADSHTVEVRTGENAQSMQIAAKTSGNGSSVNGAELLLLALATCYCNDIYREAAQRGIVVSKVEVEARGEYDGLPGHPITEIIYRAVIASDAPAHEIEALAQITDTLAEIHNTLRQGASVRLAQVELLTPEHLNEP